MPDSQKKSKSSDSHKRLSFPGIHTPKSSSKSIPQHHAVAMEVAIESPPLVFYGPSESSTGALLSGQLKININEDSVDVEQLKMRLNVEVTRKKPFHNHCPECTMQPEKLTEWNFLAGAATYKRGVHEFPFSFLLPGHLPATLRGTLSNIDYMLRATATTKSGEPIVLTKSLDVRRSIPPRDTPHHSIRIFPPTNLTANCDLPSVIHPIGESTVSMRVDGIVQKNIEAKTQTQWKLKRLTWRIDENEQEISPACAKHAAKLTTPSSPTQKGTLHQETRTLSTSELKTGWKTDYSSPDGSLSLEFPISLSPPSSSSSSHHPPPSCTMNTPSGTQITHTLIVEMIVAEELAPLKKPSQVTPTGAARVLRMHFSLTLTERAGLGISWDEEQPPLYENVPASPPNYATGSSDLYDGPLLPDYEDLEPLEPLEEEGRDGGGGG